MSFDEVFRRYRRDTVLLHPPYPPHMSPRTNSKFGGVPNLPAHYDWPRTPSGRRLHFLAQIDCADVGFPTPLPQRGVLFFFGREDEEQIWDADDPAESCRVLYALDAFAGTAPREVPADLEPIGGRWPRNGQAFLRKGEPGPRVHVEWPIQPLPIDTWPGVPPDEPDPKWLSLAAWAGWKTGPQRVTWQEAEAQRRRYKDQHDQLRARAFTKVTGRGPEYDGGDLDQTRDAVRAVFFHADAGPDAYPQYWILVHYAARAVLRDPHIMGLYGKALAPLVEQMVPIAEEWLRRSNEAGLDAPVAEEDRSAFRAWLMSVPVRFETSPPHFASDVVLLSLIATLRAWGADLHRAPLLPPHVYEAMRVLFSPFIYGQVHFSQMFGHAPSAQEPLHPDDPTICLLNLAGDSAVGWSFGAAGNCTFWITPEDLARRDFSKVWGTIVGQ